MTLTEPSTLLTDYVLGLLAAVLAVRLLHTGRREGQRAVQLWGAGFVAIALGAFAGGSYHGLGAVLSTQAHNLRVYLFYRGGLLLSDRGPPRRGRTLPVVSMYRR